MRQGGREGSGRFLATVLFADIVGSTEFVASVGDEAWRTLLSRFYALARSELKRFRGREIDTAGDGLFAAFDVPADAVGCAFAIRAGAAELGLRIRAGLHFGEVHPIEGKVGGIAVHIGSRIAAAAQPGEVLVSSTVRDVVSGSGLRFEDRGETALRGVPEPWRLFAAVPAEVGDPATGAAPSARNRRLLGSAGVAIVVVAITAVALGFPGFRAAPAASSAPASGAGFPSSGPSASVAASGRSSTSPSGAPSPSVGSFASASADASPPTSSPSASAVAVTLLPDSVARLDASGRLLAAVHVGALPDGIVVAFGSIWATNTTDGTVTRVDESGSAVIQTIRVGSSPRGIAAGFDAIWVANSDDHDVSRINPTTNEVVATVDVGIAPTAVAADEHWVWVTNRLDGTISRIDPGSGTATTFSVGSTLIGIAAVGGSVWVADFDAGSVVRVDAATGAVTARIHVGNGPSQVAASPDAVWVANARDGTVSQIDPLTETVRTVVSVGDEPSGIAIGPDVVWVAVSSTADLARIDAGTGQLLGRSPVGGSPQAVAMAGDQPVFTARATEGSHRGGTLRIVSGTETFPDSPDPAYATFWTGNLVLLTNDGLVGFKRVGGPEGLTLVPDLATSLPVPTDGGRTYTFRLRPGITYSDGRLLRASDVRRSLERASANPDAYGVLSIVGAVNCRGKSSCDLSAGITVDDVAGSVTIRLSAPDPSFLYALAFTNAFVVPADTPFGRSSAPLAGTGPYMFATFELGGEVRLVRNPYFREWSRAAQPDGYPDEILWTLAAAGTDASAAVEAGTADWTPDAPGLERVTELRTRLTDQLHVAPSQKTFFELMNTRIPPFDNLDVRRAVNFAVDRRAAVDAYGGPLEARITCQVAPPTFAGYEPYCPYTVDPDSNGSWRGPDLVQARALIDRAGVKGMKVTVYGLAGAGHSDVARYFADLLTSLGFRATTKLMGPDELFGLLSAPSDIQMAGFWTSNTIPSVRESIVGTFTCPDAAATGYLGHPSDFCDRGIDALAARAVALGATDPAAANHLWAEIDRRIVDAAPAVMAFNPTDVAFVSKRVGNYQHHPEWQTLLDQLWVQ